MKNHINYIIMTRKVRQTQVQMEAVPESSFSVAKIAKKLKPKLGRIYGIPFSVARRRIESYRICKALAENQGWLGNLRGLQHPMMDLAVLEYVKFGSVPENSRAIIRISRSARIFSNALHYIRKNIGNPKEVIFIDTREFTPGDPIEAEEFNTRIRKAAMLCGACYVDSRWLPEILDNSKQTSRSVRGVRLLAKNLRVAPRKLFANFSRKVASKFTREFSRLRRTFAGIPLLEMKPQKTLLVVFFNLRYNRVALNECRRQGIKTIAFLNTNEDPTNITFPITINTNSIPTLRLALNLIIDTLKIKLSK